MTRVIHCRASASQPAPLARLGAALAVSAVAHALLLSAPLFDVSWQGVAPGPAGAPITVRLSPAPVRMPDIPAIPIPEARHPPLPVRSPASGSEGLPGDRPASGIMGAGTDALALRGVPDPNYYPARELDDYPRPLAPLRLDRPAGAGEVRLELLIDEYGIVRDITFPGSAEPGSTHESLRGALMTTPFIPAIKDGRAVKSRIVLSVGFPTTSER